MAAVRIAVINSGCVTRQEKLWLMLMKIGCRSGCHQMPERSFFIKGWQFPVCARCTGVLAGYIIALLSCFFVMHPNIILAVACSLVMLADWLLQYFKIKASTNLRRLITGVIGGFGVMSIYCLIIIWVLAFTGS